jgi:hypothetical protein
MGASWTANYAQLAILDQCSGIKKPLDISSGLLQGNMTEADGPGAGHIMRLAASW